jgi:AraC-like DNA-binding protein
MKNLEVFSDLSERLNYNLPEFPLYVRKGTLNQFDNFEAAAHWHSDVEFIYILEGSMEYSVNGQTVCLDAGTGIFVNSHRLHFGFSQMHCDCSFIVVVIHSSLIGEGASLMQAYWEEKFGPHMDDFLVLTDKIVWQQNILSSIQAIYAEMHNSFDPNPFRLTSQALSLCAGIGDHLQPKVGSSQDVQLWTNVQKMTRFIHQHYEQKITLEDIASAGAVCRSRCCTLFNKYVGQTPNNYLTRYRLRKSCEMLRETQRSVSEIALACGFQSVSYFSSLFRKQIGLVPLAYRKNDINDQYNV